MIFESLQKMRGLIIRLNVRYSRSTRMDLANKSQANSIDQDAEYPFQDPANVLGVSRMKRMR